ncbi:MAG: hypothetical protein JXB06_12505 [Spirochaetales bacterium]|nr:hypothetical protein [Spirochaetales bacterium]
MARTSVLPSFVGNRDPYPETEGEEYGPLLSLLQPLPERFAEAVDGMRADAFGLPVRAFLKK